MQRPSTARVRASIGIALATGVTATVTALSPATPATAEPTPTPSSTSPSAAGQHGEQVSQTGRINVLPQIAQRGRRPGNPNGARVAVVAKFRPGVKGRPVALQRKTRSGWRTVARKPQNRNGKVTFNARARMGGKAVSYRAKALRYGGRARVTTGRQSLAQWNVLFGDRFSGRGLNLRKWEYRQTGIYTDNRTRSTPSPRAVRQNKGTVKLMVKRDRSRRRGYFLNGMIGTRHSFDFKYGVAAARIKFPMLQGQHGAFWLQATNPKRILGNPRRSGAEIDAVEFFGRRWDGGIGAGAFYWAKNGHYKKVGGIYPRASKLKPKGDSWWTSYHVFSVEWTPRWYIYRIDGQEFYRTREGVSGIREFPILSLLTSDWELNRLKKSALPTRMSVDWVRVWQR